jgi:hypothetical protein
LPLSGKIVIH